jgi:hypothetical protein
MASGALKIIISGDLLYFGEASMIFGKLAQYFLEAPQYCGEAPMIFRKLP